MKRMVRALVAIVVLATTLSFAQAMGPCATEARAQGSNRAGLVVQFAGRPAQYFCVSFEEESITGYELLRRSGLPMTVQDYGGGNITVCSIDGQGCSYPKQQCFCECTDLSNCTLWGFYTIDSSGAWQFSEEGAGVVRVRNGDVSGWRWAKQTTTGGAPPNAETLASVCAKGKAIGLISTTPGSPARGRGSVTGLIITAAVFAALAVFAVLRGRRRGEEDA